MAAVTSLFRTDLRMLHGLIDAADHEALTRLAVLASRAHYDGEPTRELTVEYQATRRRALAKAATGEG